jgi:phosphatidylglycerophosphate synthase
VGLRWYAANERDVKKHEHQHSAALLRRSAVLAVIGLVTVVAAAMALRSPLAVDRAFPARVAAVAGVVLIAALASLRPWHPFAQLGAANVLTGARTLLMALLAGVALAPETPGSTWLLVSIATAGATADLFDGMLARRSGLASRFGARFDMEVDALLVMVLSILAWRAAGVGPWILAAGLLRYAFVAAGWALRWMRAELPPSRRRQTACVVQITALIAALVPGLPHGAATAISLGGLLVLAWSFAVDLQWLAGHRQSARGHTIERAC